MVKTTHHQPVSSYPKPDLLPQKSDIDSPSLEQVPESPIGDLRPAASLSTQQILQLRRVIGNRAAVKLLSEQKRPSAPVQRLPDQLQGSMEKIFGDKLSGVNIHTDAHANQIARAAKTGATTIDSEIYFQDGAYRPGTADGNALIAREVAHIQRAKLTGSSDAKPSAQASESDKRDAEGVSDAVKTLGSNPTQVLHLAGKNPTPMQMNVLQRNYSHSRVAGIVTSKVVQGIFTTVLGPVGLVWRWPLIQKNLGEITGWEQVGTRKGKKDDKGNLVDKMRYGGGNLGTAMRWMAGISELLKEFTIWLGFGTFIAAIVAAATHGAAAPVFAGLAIATAVTAGLHFLLRSLLVTLNGYRLYKETKKGTSKADLALIKHQMVSDGVEGIGAALSAIFGGLGAGGVTSAGGALSNAVGVGSTENASKLAGFGMGAVSQGLGTTIATNSGKEIGKDSVKPDTKVSGFWGGFTKDALEIQGGYTTKGKMKVGSSYTGTPQQPPVNNLQQQPPVDNQQPPVNDQQPPVNDQQPPVNDQQPPVNDQQPPVNDQQPPVNDVQPQVVNNPQDQQQVVAMVGDIQNASHRNTVDQSEHTQDAVQNNDVIQNIAPSIVSTSDKVASTGEALQDTQKKSEELDPQLGGMMKSVKKGEVETLTKDVDEGLEKSGEPKTDKVEGKDDGKDELVDLKRDELQRKPGIGSRIKSWFAKKLSSLKSGVKRLNNKILGGVMSYATKFNKSEEDRQAVALAMNEEKTFAAKDVKNETANDGMFKDYEDKAGQLSEGVKQLESENK